MSLPAPPAMPTPAAPRSWTKSADRPLRSGRKSLGIWCMARALGVPVPWSAVRQTDGAALLAFEHERLQTLAAAGEHVPAVLAFDGQHLVTSDIGTTLDRHLGALPLPERLPLMCAAAVDLAAFHARGHWHGGSQTRNLTWDGRQFARLDFEERLVPAMPLSVVQPYDALQLLLSMTHHLEQLGPDAVRQVLQAYAAAGGPQVPDLRPFVQRLLPRLRAVLRLVGWSPRLRTSREARRLRTVLDGMSAFVADRSAG